LVESGLAVSGANVRDPSARANLGYITAEELVGLNLDKCRMMTLSACETGRGQEVTGQGVLGLRAAIMSCGVRSILMSVWKVNDESTTKLMNEFYNNLWVKRLSKAEALRQAQLAMKNDPVPSLRTPVNWGAWVLVGEGW
jgi:CHAT domain-containing protein